MQDRQQNATDFDDGTDDAVRRFWRGKLVDIIEIGLDEGGCERRIMKRRRNMESKMQDLRRWKTSIK